MGQRMVYDENGEAYFVDDGEDFGGYMGSGDQEGDYDMPTTPPYYMGGGDQEGDYDMPTNPPNYMGGGDQEGDYPMPGSGGGFDWNRFLGSAGKLFDSAGKFVGDNKGLMGLLAALGGAYAGKQGVRPNMGGGTTQAYAGPSKPLTGAVTQGKYGPIYAANGGLMQAYVQGGPVQMESGGFVMTKKAVDGAGGPQGLRSLVPGARMIRGPGTGTSDDVPAVIQGRSGTTPARLSNGEAYVPRQQVQEQGGAKRLYSLMNQLQGSK